MNGQMSACLTGVNGQMSAGLTGVNGQMSVGLTGVNGQLPAGKSLIFTQTQFFFHASGKELAAGISMQTRRLRAE